MARKAFPKWVEPYDDGHALQCARCGERLLRQTYSSTLWDGQTVTFAEKHRECRAKEEPAKWA